MIKRPEGNRQDSGAEEVDAGAAVHLTPQHFEAIDVALDGPVAPPFADRAFHRPRAIFADRLVSASAQRVHHTERFGAVVHLVGRAVGGLGGERLLARLGMAISDDTILRLLKGTVI